MVVVILAVSAVLILLDYTRSRAEAIETAEAAMNSHSGRLRDKLLVVGSESMVPVTLIAELGMTFLAPPPTKIGEKIAMARAGLAQSPMLDGLYVGYPDGSFFHAIRLTSEAWRDSLESPEGAELAIRTMSPSSPGMARAIWPSR